MVLESTMLCLDNSEWMRNGDYAPSRLEAQQDAAGMLCNDRTRNNPESTVGVLTMAGKGVNMLVSPTEDAGKVLAAFAGITVGGKNDLATAIQIAQLALKHRKNKNGGQRIIVFVGSPVTDDVIELQRIGKLLKKNSVAVDVISIGDQEENNGILLEFVNAVCSNDNSRLISVPPGVLPCDALNASPVMFTSTNFGHGDMGGAAGGMGGGGAGGFDDFGGADAFNDPELAMALRVSAEEARSKEEARAQAQQSVGGATETPSASASSSSSSSAAPEVESDFGGGFGGAGAMDEEDEEMLMQRALELSMLDITVENTTATSTHSTSSSSSSSSILASFASPPPASASDRAAVSEEEHDEEEAALRMALEMSMSEGDQPAASHTAAAPTATTTPAITASTANTSVNDSFLDPAFVSQLLGSVDVDMSDPLIQAALAQLGAVSHPQPGSSSSGGNTGGEDKDKDSKKRKGDDV